MNETWNLTTDEFKRKINRDDMEEMEAFEETIQFNLFSFLFTMSQTHFYSK